MTDEMKEETGESGPMATETATPPTDVQRDTESSQEAEASSPTEPEQADQEKKFEPIPIDPDDLTEEAREQAEEKLNRKIEDLAYRMVEQEPREGSLVALRLAVTRDVYLAEQEILLNDLRKEITLPGYRKGKAPLKLVQIRLGDEAVRDTVGSIAVNLLRQEIAKQNFKISARPQVMGYATPGDDQDELTFEIEIEVEPEVELKQYKDLSVEVEVQPVIDEAVDDYLERLRLEGAVTESGGPDAVFKEGDELVVDVVVTNDRGERLDHLCKTGQNVNDLASELPGELGGQLVGKKVGESVAETIKNTVTNRRGQEVTHEDTYTVTVRDIKVSRLPELDDEFAKDLSEYDTLAELKTALREELEDREEERRRVEALAKLFDQIIEKNPVQAPRSMTAAAQYDQIMRDSYQLSRLGMRLGDVVRDADKYMHDQRDDAAQSVKRELLTLEIAKTEKLEVTDADVDKEIERMAEASGRKALAVRARLEANKELDGLRSRLERAKIADFLLEHNEVKNVPAKPKEAPAEAPVAADAAESTVDESSPEGESEK